ncbi:hypothetical protein FA15DRAFT_672703 [Coprinopsis marcescibilis]|uniref:Transcription termination and cleavage factor C-terminal domain-containing protein n=1 Tax=Coprinopsis marcescibilis TaxID=230819 RepID=A0A5C3KMI0_COPMA|nr:hypothetical protein FA15DRAFT_672703 [Coprinopsis marcescibilis]
MSNAPNLPTEQLLELMVTLKKTTPASARTILNGQPAIAYALIKLMVAMNAINIEVFQKTLQASASQAAPAPVPAPIAPAPQHQPTSSIGHVHPPPLPPHMTPTHSHSSSSTPIPALPPHMHQMVGGYSNSHPGYRTSTPPHPTPTPPMSMGMPPPPQAVYGGYPISNGYNNMPPPPGQYSQPGQPTGAPYGYPGYPPQSMGMPPPQSAPMPPPGLSETLAAIPEDQKALIMQVISMTPDQIHALPPQQRSTYIQIRATLGISTPGG